MDNIKHVIFCLIFTCLYACKSPKQEAATDTLQSKTWESSTTSDEDCYYPRKTIRSINEENGTIIKVSEYFMIETEKKGRYQPCEMPEDFKKEGLEVVFSGDKLEINPNERRMGTPFRLKKLSLK